MLLRTLVLGVALVGFVLASPRPADALHCGGGCSKAKGTCSQAITVTYKGCRALAIENYLAALPACKAAGDCTAEVATFKADKALCKTNKINSYLAQCPPDLASCTASCNAKEEICADTCGVDPVLGLKKCATDVGAALGTCKGACAGDGTCIQNCGSTAQADYGTCRSMFDACITPCPNL
jgi:hypothetical protein